MKNQWVVVGSSNGSSNYGDEMMWMSAVEVLRAEDPEGAVVTDAFPGWTPPFADVETLPFLHAAIQRYTMLPSRFRLVNKVKGATGLLLNRGALQRGYERISQIQGGAPTSGIEKLWEDRIKTSRGVIFSGAGGMTDRFALHAIAGWGATVALARRHDVPVIFLGQGVGPLLDPASRRVAGQMLADADVVSTRDDFSAEEVAALTGRRETSAVLDWAVVNPPHAAVESVVRSFIDESEMTTYVAISLHDWTSATEDERTRVRSLMRGVAEFAVESGDRVLCVPNCVGIQRADDRSFMQDAIDDLPTELRSVFIQTPSSFDAYATRRLLREAKFLVSSRYHPLVFALAEGTPAVGVAYDDYYVQKHAGALRWYDVEPIVLDIRQTAPDGAWWLDVAERLGSIDCNELVARTEELRPETRNVLLSWLREVTHG